MSSAKDHTIMVAAILAAGGIAWYAIPAILAAIGFGPLGIIGGSFAALWQSYIGNVSAGSIFSGITFFIIPNYNVLFL